MMHALMAQQSKTEKATVSQWCRVLDVSRSGFYTARQRQTRPRRDSLLSVQAKAAFEASGQSYGSRRLSAALKSQGLAVGRQQARTLMRSNGVRARAGDASSCTPQTAATHCLWRPMCWPTSSTPIHPIALGFAT